MTRIREGRATIETGDAFYNPAMVFNRDISVAAVASLEARYKRRVCDGFAASGIRGIRYCLEGGASYVAFVEKNPSYASLCEANARTNGLSSFDVFTDDVIHHLLEHTYDFIELDPFGSPVPYFYPAFHALRKEGVLSITATDTAVWCGAHRNACIKDYYTYPLKSEFFNEVGIRLLWYVVARHAGLFNYGMKPLFSLARRHYFKVCALFRRSAADALATAKQWGFLSYCRACLHRETSFTPVPRCSQCGHITEIAGPLWLGELHDRSFLDKMSSVFAGLENKIAHETIERMKGEIGMPPWFFDLHELAHKEKQSAPPLHDFLTAVQQKGYRCVRTHFKNTGFKTDADITLLRSCLTYVCRAQKPSSPSL